MPTLSVHGSLNWMLLLKSLSLSCVNWTPLALTRRHVLSECVNPTPSPLSVMYVGSQVKQHTSHGLYIKIEEKKIPWRSERNMQIMEM